MDMVSFLESTLLPSTSSEAAASSSNKKGNTSSWFFLSGFSVVFLLIYLLVAIVAVRQSAKECEKKKSWAFLKAILQEIVRQKLTYFALAFHVLDQATDLQATYEYWCDWRNGDGVNGSNPQMQFILSLCILGLHRVVSVTGVWLASRSVLNAVMQLFDLAMIRVIYDGHLQRLRKPGLIQRYLQTLEAVWESFPQLLLAADYVVRSRQWRNPVLLVQMFFSFVTLLTRVSADDEMVFPSAWSQPLSKPHLYAFRVLVFRLAELSSRVATLVIWAAFFNFYWFALFFVLEFIIYKIGHPPKAWHSDVEFYTALLYCKLGFDSHMSVAVIRPLIQVSFLSVCIILNILPRLFGIVPIVLSVISCVAYVWLKSMGVLKEIKLTASARDINAMVAAKNWRALDEMLRFGGMPAVNIVSDRISLADIMEMVSMNCKSLAGAWLKSAENEAKRMFPTKKRRGTLLDDVLDTVGAPLCCRRCDCLDALGPEHALLQAFVGWPAKVSKTILDSYLSSELSKSTKESHSQETVEAHVVAMELSAVSGSDAKGLEKTEVSKCCFSDAHSRKLAIFHALLDVAVNGPKQENELATCHALNGTLAVVLTSLLFKNNIELLIALSNTTAVLNLMDKQLSLEYVSQMTCVGFDQIAQLWLSRCSARLSESNVSALCVEMTESSESIGAIHYPILQEYIRAQPIRKKATYDTLHALFDVCAHFRDWRHLEAAGHCLQLLHVVFRAVPQIMEAVLQMDGHWMGETMATELAQMTAAQNWQSSEILERADGYNLAKAFYLASNAAVREKRQSTAQLIYSGLDVTEIRSKGMRDRERTVSLLRLRSGHVLGGFADCIWKMSDKPVTDLLSFCFVLRANDYHCCRLFPAKGKGHLLSTSYSLGKDKLRFIGPVFNGFFKIFRRRSDKRLVCEMTPSHEEVFYGFSQAHFEELFGTAANQDADWCVVDKFELFQL